MVGSGRKCDPAPGVVRPDRAWVPFRDYAETWIEQRPGLRPSTSALYRRLLDRYISPKLGSTHLNAIDTAMVRKWRSDLLRAGVSESMAAKATGCCMQC